MFGPAAEELFSAYHIARYVDAVAAAGKAEYPLPMAVNCWLDKGEEPGKYPSGGPVSRTREVWRFAAPHIDLYGPDIYVPNFCEVCGEYTRWGEPLFIPECAAHSYAGPRLVYTVGRYHALCCAPFGFEDMGLPFTGVQGMLFGVDVTDPALKTPQDTGEYRWYNETLRALLPQLTARYGTDQLQAVCAERAEDSVLDFGAFQVQAAFEHPMLQKKDGVCLGIKTGPDECVLLACRCGLMFASGDPERPNLDILRLEEGRVENGAWRATRRLNGDEAAFLKFDEPVLLRLRVFTYA